MGENLFSHAMNEAKFRQSQEISSLLEYFQNEASFRRHEKKRKERLEEEYKFKAVRLKTTVKHKG